MQLRECAHKRLRERRERSRHGRRILGERRGERATQDHAVDVLHEVERRTDHRGVIASGQRLRHRHAAGMQRGQDAVLPTHIVRHARLHATRWPTQYQRAPAVLALVLALDRDQIREIRKPGGELPDEQTRPRRHQLR